MHGQQKTFIIVYQIRQVEENGLKGQKRFKALSIFKLSRNRQKYYNTTHKTVRPIGP